MEWVAVRLMELDALVRRRFFGVPASADSPLQIGLQAFARADGTFGESPEMRVLVGGDVLPDEGFAKVCARLTQRPERDVQVPEELAVRTVEPFRDVGGSRSRRLSDLIAELAVPTDPRTISYWDQLVPQLH